MKTTTGERRARRITIAAILLSAVSCARAPKPAAKERPVIRVLGAQFLSHAPFFLALDGGEFDKQGLNIEFMRVASGNESMTALVAGQADVMLANVNVGFLNMVSKGERPRIVADKGYGAPKTCVERGFVVRKDVATAAGTKEGLKGLRIVVTKASPSAYHLDLELSAMGTSLEKMELLDISPADRPAAFAAGRLDLANATEPMLSQLSRAGGIELWRKADERIPGGVLLFGGRLIDHDRDQGLRFLRAYLWGVAKLREGKTPGNIEALARRTGLDRAVVEGACWPEVRTDGRLEPSALKGYARWAHERGYLDADLDGAKAMDLSLLDDIARADRAK